jgi:hypothetical protein
VIAEVITAEVAFLPVPALDVISGRFCVVVRKEPILASADPPWREPFARC